MEAITIRNLVKNYNGVEALKNISLVIEKGEFFGLLGPNGAGKTTTIRILVGLTSKTSGSVRVFGNDVVKDYKESRAFIGFVPQEFNLDIWETVYNTVFFSAGYFGIPASKRHSKIKTILKQLDLWHKKDSKVYELSGGMKRKLMIARALVHDPELLILDEPTAGVDIETRRRMWSLLKGLNKDGKTILLTTHYLEEAEELCETIAIIHKGRIIKVGHKKNLLNIFDRETVEVELNSPLKDRLKGIDYSISKDRTKLTFEISEKDWKKVISILKKLNVNNIRTHKTTLEDVFLHLTK